MRHIFPNYFSYENVNCFMMPVFQISFIFGYYQIYFSLLNCPFPIMLSSKSKVFEIRSRITEIIY